VGKSSPSPQPSPPWRGSWGSRVLPRDGGGLVVILDSMRGRTETAVIFYLANSGLSVQRGGSLKAAENFRHQCSPMSGNPVRIRDGCATVRATTPNATAHGREGGKKARSPKSGYRLDCTRRPRTIRGTSPQREGWGQSAKLFFGGSRRMPSFSVLWNEGFLFKGDGAAPREGTRPATGSRVGSRGLQNKALSSTLVSQLKPCRSNTAAQN